MLGSATVNTFPRQHTDTTTEFYFYVLHPVVYVNTTGFVPSNIRPGFDSFIIKRMKSNINNKCISLLWQSHCFRLLEHHQVYNKAINVLCLC
jgi:hypothetical protein